MLKQSEIFVNQNLFKQTQADKYCTQRFKLPLTNLVVNVSISKSYQYVLYKSNCKIYVIKNK